MVRSNYKGVLKRYGQHFLTDKKIIEKIIDEISPGGEDHIVEIGPGGGALTGDLFNKSGQYTGIEIDERWIELLKGMYQGINIINRDFLKINLEDISEGKKIRVAGNIPYNITSDILQKLLKERRFINDAVLMMQHEAAERFFSETGSKTYGPVPASMGLFTENRYCFGIPPEAFSPRPHVDSAVVHIFFKDEQFDLNFDKTFFALLRDGFVSRRKTMKNSLKNSMFNVHIDKLDKFDLSRRAETFSPGEFADMARILTESIYE